MHWCSTQTTNMPRKKSIVANHFLCVSLEMGFVCKYFYKRFTKATYIWMNYSSTGDLDKISTLSCVLCMGWIYDNYIQMHSGCLFIFCVIALINGCDASRNPDKKQFLKNKNYVTSNLSSSMCYRTGRTPAFEKNYRVYLITKFDWLSSSVN